jgi:hypothetical protein
MSLSSYVVQPIQRASIFILLIVVSCNSKHQLTEIKKLNYPSASGIEYLDGKMYTIGDDANFLMQLDSSLTSTDSMQLYAFPEKRIPKAVKTDLECMAITTENKLLLLGSGSSPNRNNGWLIDFASKQKDSISLSALYDRIKLTGIAELNIEGACFIPGFLVLANRGSKGNPHNSLLFIHHRFLTTTDPGSIENARFGFSNSSSFKGVSGLAYSSKSDKLICTISTEDTRNSMEDGTIGKSYLWIVNAVSTKRKWKAINPDTIIDLESIDTRFKGHKIESVCITGETAKQFHLLLAADNDDGSSTLFRISIKKD